MQTPPSVTTPPLILQNRLAGVPEDDVLESSLEESNVFDGVQRPAAGSINSRRKDVEEEDEQEEDGPVSGRTKRSGSKRLESLEPNTWSWSELEKKKVGPPWIPQLVSGQ